MRRRAPCRRDRSAIPARGREPRPHRSKQRQQSWRPPRVKQGSWGYCSFGDRAWRARVEVSRFRHAKEIKQKSASRDASQNEKGSGKTRMNNDKPSQGCAQCRANALRGNHGALRQIEMAGAACQIRDNERKKRAIKAGTDAIETLDREQPNAIIRYGVEKTAQGQ